MNNPYAEELLRLIDYRFNVDRDDMTTTEWLTTNTTLKGKKFSVDKYPFQRALLDETARSAVTIKPSQVGVSELYQRDAAAKLTRNRHRRGIYSYPDDEMRKKNAQTRFLPMVDTTKAFLPKDGTNWTRSINLIQFDTSFLFLTGSKVGDATSTDADFVYLDEYDLHNMEIAALFSSRLQNSDWKIERYFSTPSFTEFGVDALYNQSDQMEYLIKCDACNHWQFPMFDQRFVEIPNLPSDFNDLLEINTEAIDSYKLDLRGSYVCCEKCRSKLDLGREDNRAWVAKHPSRQTMRGRKVNPFSVSTRPVFDIVAELLKYKTRDFMRGFKNTVLGEPEDSSNSRIEANLITLALKSPSIPTIDQEQPVWIGVDMGHTCHLTALQGADDKKKRSVVMEEVPLAQLRGRIQELLGIYNVVGGMVDRHPESQVAQDIWDDTNGLIVPGEYRGDAEMNLKMLVEDPEKVHYVQINRTLHLDQVVRALRRGELEFYGYGLLGAEIMAQLRNMVRVEEPEVPAVWKKLNPNDHFFHSLAFAYSAMKLSPYTENKLGPTLSMLGFATADLNYGSTGLLNRKEPKWQAQSRLY